MNKTLVLIGLSGCGKSTLGKQMAKKLNRVFYDLDEEIEKREGCSISGLFKEKGEAYFRKVEWEAFMHLLELPPCVIASGGGLIPEAYNNGYAKPSNAFFIFIDVSLEDLHKRLSVPEARSVRPLMSSADDLWEKIVELSSKRRAAYLDWADATLKNTSNG